MSSQSEADGFGAGEVPRVNVLITSVAHGSELFVVNRGYALIAKGVGSLSLDLVPGRYRVRQRIGYSEQVVDLDVLPGVNAQVVQLPRLEFPSPIPLPCSSLASQAPRRRPFSYGSGTFRFVLRSPCEEDGALSDSQVDHMHAEMAGLRLESFDGKLSVPFEATSEAAAAHGALTFSSEQPPGVYVVVQKRDDDRQICMPIVVAEGRTTAVFSLSLVDEGQPVPVELGHAAMAMLRQEDLTRGYEDSLLRLEAARKALAAGRFVYGWSDADHEPDAAASLQLENVLLDIMDAYLGWHCSNARAEHWERLQQGGRALQVDRAGLLRRLKRASSVLGDASADVVALAHALNADSSNVQMLPVNGPPLLRRSWELLLSSDQGNAEAASVMVFPYQVESSSTWFRWSEQPGARAEAVAREITQNARILLQDPAGVLGPVGDSSILANASVWARQGLKVARDVFIARLPSGKQLPALTLENVEATLAALLEDESFEDWLDKAQSLLSADRRTIKDESMRQLISGLRSLSDPTLLKALGADAVVKQVIAALSLPRNRIVQLVEELLSAVLNGVDHADKTAIRDAFGKVVGVAETWLDLGQTLGRTLVSAPESAGPGFLTARTKALSLHVGLNSVSAGAYAGWDGSLAACESDANDMAAVARAKGMHTTVLLTKNATRSAVLAAMRGAAQELDGGGFFFLTYSGHGGRVPDTTRDRIKNEHRTWCLYDGQLLDDELYYQLSLFGSGVRVLVLSDSGAVASAAAIPPAIPLHRLKLMPESVAMRSYREHQHFYDKVQSDLDEAWTVDPKSPNAHVAAGGRPWVTVKKFDPAVILIFGSGDDQTSIDGEQNGAFTEQLLRVWDQGTFQGNYAEFHALIRAQMPAGQSPNLATLGPAEQFLAQKPFTV